jgi:hypothetical protein
MICVAGFSATALTATVSNSMLASFSVRGNLPSAFLALAAE